MSTMVQAPASRFLSWLRLRASGPDRGAVGQQADLHLFNQSVEHGNVGCERSLQVGPAGEDHEANEVPLAATHKLANGFARHGEPVARLKVRRLHAARDIERHDDVARLEASRFGLPATWDAQADQEDETARQHHGWQLAPLDARRFRLGREKS
jgi:hypothetical protein